MRWAVVRGLARDAPLVSTWLSVLQNNGCDAQSHNSAKQHVPQTICIVKQPLKRICVEKTKSIVGKLMRPVSAELHPNNHEQEANYKVLIKHGIQFSLDGKKFWI